MRVSLVSPYHGGSHLDWAEGYRRQSRHQVRLLTLPARFWKWRMHGGAVTLARRFLQEGAPSDCILATDMLDLSTFLGLLRRRSGRLPAILYMHENQLNYPLPDDPRIGPMRRQLGERDQHYAFVNYSSMLVADRVLFNSHFHFDSWFQSLPAFLRHFPEHRNLCTVEELRAKSEVLPVGLRLPRRFPTSKPSTPLLLWNQRWEYDKNPRAFFKALERAAGWGLDFQVALCGERFSRSPVEFDEGLERLGGRVVHQGFAEAGAYRRLLAQATVVLSTAWHEFFGVSVLEAIAHGAFPVLPKRLSYPELIPAEFHKACLYADSRGLDRRLEWAITNPEEAFRQASRIASHLALLDWRRLAQSYDEILERVRSE